MTHPYSNIHKVASATGSILGITKNLLGGPDAIIEPISPGGMLGDVERAILSGNTVYALKELAKIRTEVAKITIQAHEIA